jgi:hypothetical protein
MKFGTLQSIKKVPTETNTDDEFDFGANGDTQDEFGDEFSSEFGDEGEDEFGELDAGEDEFGEDDVGDSDPLSSVMDRLAALKNEISDILSDMGYDEGESEFGEDEFGEDEFGDEGESEFGEDEFGDEGESEFGEDEFGDEGDSEFGEDEFGEEGEDEFGEEGEGEPDFQGDIRTVKGADLVYKRKQEDGNLEELWIYNVGNDIRTETTIRKAILAGTDIAPAQRESEDGSQKADTYTIGNVQYLRISGLPN